MYSYSRSAGCKLSAALRWFIETWGFFLSQEYTEDKSIKLTTLSSKRRLFEALLIVIAAFAVYLMVTLLSFNQADPSLSQSQSDQHGPVHNMGGRIGAWLSDILFSAVGIFAYVIPPILFIVSVMLFRQRYKQVPFDYFTISLRLLGVVSLILASCGLAAFNVDDIYVNGEYCFASGGVIGSLLSSAMFPLFSGTGANLALLALWAVGFTLFTGWSWLTIAEKIGSVILNTVAFFTNFTRRDDDATARRTITNRERGVREPALRLQREETVPEPDDILLSDLSSLSTKNNDENNLLQKATETETVLKKVEPLSEVAISTVPEKAASLVNPIQPEAAVTRSVRDIPLITSTDYAASLQDNDEDEPQVEHRINHEKENNGPIFSISPEISQVKQGIGPELPKPNPVRVPTRRELASYGIKLPSQRLAEQQAREQAKATNNQVSSEASGATEDDNEMMRLRHEYEQVQQLRHAQTQETEENLDDEEHEEQNRLAQEFAAQQLQRYDRQIPTNVSGQTVSEMTKGAVSSSYHADSSFLFYPVDESESVKPKASSEQNVHSEPLFTPSAEPENRAAQHQQQQYSGVEIRISGVKPDAPSEQTLQQKAMQESLIHPFLMRNEQPLQKPSTPLPTFDLLTAPPETEEPVDVEALQETASLVEARLADYRIKADVVGISPGPVITRYELDLAPGVKAARISNLSRDLARSLSAVAVRVVEVIPGKPYVGLELPNKHRRTVYLREVLDCPRFRDTASPLAIVLGKDIAGQPVVADLAKMPHLLVAGTTGSGKSVGVNAMIISMLYKATPDEVRFIMIDPKMLELSVYEGIPHLLTEVVTDMKDAANALRWCVGEMERRYKLMSALGVRNIAGYNERIKEAEDMGRPIPDPFWKPTDNMDLSPPLLEKLPYIVVMVDEFADLMMAVGKKVEELIARLAQKARAAGIHLVLATQRPSVDVITGLIKANIPTRIAFTVSSKIDSRTILDQAGAESLLGMGDMLYLPPNSSIPVRVHGAFVRDEEVHAVVQDWKARGRPQYVDGILSAGDEGENTGFGFEGDEDLDPLFDQAVQFVVEKRRASISGVQRQFRIGYNRAARIIEQMEMQGIVSSPGHNGNREVLAPPPHE